MKKSAKGKRGGKRPGAGRKPLSPEGRHQINLRATPEQQAAWQAAADDAGMSFSEWVRSVLDRKASE